MSAIFDRLETVFTRQPRKGYPPWMLFYNPSLALGVTDAFPAKMLLRMLFVPPLRTTILLVPIFGFFLGVAAFVIFVANPGLYTHERIRQNLLGIFLTWFLTSIRWTPWIYLGLVLFDILRYCPRYFFWNRRATRLIAEGYVPEPVPVPVPIVEEGVWPPAPVVTETGD